MRTPIAIAVACIAAFLTVDAAPSCVQKYTVTSSDKSCSLIAKHAHVSTSVLHKLNANLNSKCSNVKPGQKLCVKTGTSKQAIKKKATTKKKTTTKKKVTIKKKTTTTKKKTTTKKTTTTKKVSKSTAITSKQKPTNAAMKPTTTAPTTTTTTTTTTTSTAATPTYTYNYGLTAQLSSGQDFCIFLPRSPGNKEDNGGVVDKDAIANSEKSAAAFCTRPNVKAPGARTLPVGFIKTAHYYADNQAGYVQVTGKFEPSLWELSSQDEGGQYDNHGRGSPPLSMCYGYRYYVNMIEPNDSTYCIRCCKTYQDCNAGRSAYGCKRIVPNGVYE